MKILHNRAGQKSSIPHPVQFVWVIQENRMELSKSESGQVTRPSVKIALMITSGQFTSAFVFNQDSTHRITLGNWLNVQSRGSMSQSSAMLRFTKSVSYSDTALATLLSSQDLVKTKLEAK